MEVANEKSISVRRNPKIYIVLALRRHTIAPSDHRAFCLTVRARGLLPDVCVCTAVSHVWRLRFVGVLCARLREGVVEDLHIRARVVAAHTG